LYEDEMKKIEEEIMPFGFINNGIDDDIIIDQDGTLWQ